MWSKLIVIYDWFGELKERLMVVRDFNKAAKYAFISLKVPTLIQCKITKGDPNYRHNFSKWRGGGFRIKALSGHPLPKSSLIEIAKVVLDNEELVRKLVALGWDTLEVHDNSGYVGIKYPLMKHLKIGGYLNS